MHSTDVTSGLGKEQCGPLFRHVCFSLSTTQLRRALRVAHRWCKTDGLLVRSLCYTASLNSSGLMEANSHALVLFDLAPCMVSTPPQACAPRFAVTLSRGGFERGRRMI